jgi:hypothetical protein
MPDALNLEMAVTMPWTVAEGGSLWVASGRSLTGGRFEGCLLRCVPEEFHGQPGMRLFEALVYGVTHGLGFLVAPDGITRAREVLLVFADDPLTAVEPDDQDTVEHAIRDRGVV